MLIESSTEFVLLDATTGAAIGRLPREYRTTADRDHVSLTPTGLAVLAGQPMLLT